MSESKDPEVEVPPAPAAVAIKEPVSKAPVCPFCKGELTKHGDTNPAKAGAWHCNGCGACWAPGIKRLREGHPSPDGWPADS